MLDNPKGLPANDDRVMQSRAAHGCGDYFAWLGYESVQNSRDRKRDMEDRFLPPDCGVPPNGVLPEPQVAVAPVKRVGLSAANAARLHAEVENMDFSNCTFGKRILMIAEVGDRLREEERLDELRQRKIQDRERLSDLLSAYSVFG